MPFLILAGVLTLLLALPKKASHPLRSASLATMIPIWRSFDCLATKFYSSIFAFRYHQNPYEKESDRRAIEKLETDNQLLRTQIDTVREWLLSEERLEREVALFESIEKKGDSLELRERDRCIANQIEAKLRSLPAKVIYREPAIWSETVWIDVGYETSPIVEKNSPIVCGSSLVGIVERAEKRRSLVRLITDPTLSVAVRIRRGKEEDRALALVADQLLSHLRMRPETGHEIEKWSGFAQALKNDVDLYLAKGILHGSSHSLGRHRSSFLIGEGFNYAFSDREGKARDLRSGNRYGDEKKENEPLARRGDLLVTSGLDGLFPEGLHVAIVKELEPLEEGDFAIKLFAWSTLGSLDEITHLQVLPSLCPSNGE